MKFILILISTMSILLSCSSTKNTSIVNNNITTSSLVDEMNKSIIDGFFDGDTIGKNLSGVYFLKNDSINLNDSKKSIVSKD